MKTPIFIGRQAELKILERISKRSTSSLVVITGRRRIGKSRLVEEFARNKTLYTFSGLPPESGITAQTQREEFARQMQTHWLIPPLKAENWGDLFLLLSEKIKHNALPTVVLFDEISWMEAEDATFLGQLKIAWDVYFKKNAHCVFILCGSVSTWIEENILSSTGFFGRITQQIHLEELPIKECVKLLHAQGLYGSSMEYLSLLSVTGGIPWYLELIDANLSTENNIKSLCFSKHGILVEEFYRIFHDLFRTRTDICQKIVEALAKQSLGYQEIAKVVNYPTGGPLSSYLHSLVVSGYLACDANWSFKSSKDTRIQRYRLKDNYLRFYLRYVAPNLSKIQKGHFEDIPLSTLPGWPSILGLQFENLVLNNRKLLWEALGLNPAEIVNDNPYYQRQTINQQACQIDYLIQTRYNTVYACEIKFSRIPVDSTVIMAMQEKCIRLKIPKSWTCIPVLIHVNGVNFEQENYFFKTIDFMALTLAEH